VSTGYFIDRFAFSAATLTVFVGPHGGPHQKIVFEHVRPFLFFKESDFCGGSLPAASSEKIFQGGDYQSDAIIRAAPYPASDTARGIDE
jgi:hypothetical protein